MRIHTIFPEEFPEPWASDWGEDDYGIFMGFTYKGVRQDFRWIEPDTFLMGSPKDEPEREDVETQHVGCGEVRTASIETQIMDRSSGK